MIALAHAPAPASYHVKPGDTLSAIASRFYGTPRDYPEIQAVNPQVKNPNLIYVDEVLKIPARGHAAHLDAAQMPPPLSKHAPKHLAAPKPKFTPHTPVYTPVHAASGNMVQIARYFESHGATRAAAAGVAACIWGESEGNPESSGDGGFGYIGWTGNTIGLPKGFHGPTGNAAADSAAELPGVVGYINANGGWGPINKAGGPAAAAQVFSSRYERPAVLYSDIHYGGAGDPYAIYNALLG